MSDRRTSGAPVDQKLAIFVLDVLAAYGPSV
jgi:hypothetical protein